MPRLEPAEAFKEQGMLPGKQRMVLCYPMLLCFPPTLMGGSYLWLVVVLHRHSDDIDPNDKRDEEVEIVAGAEGVNVLPRRGIVSVVRPALGFCRKKERQRNERRPCCMVGSHHNVACGLCLTHSQMQGKAHGRTDSSKPREMAI